jgi:hypothetical protein
MVGVAACRVLVHRSQCASENEIQMIPELPTELTSFYTLALEVQRVHIKIFVKKCSCWWCSSHDMARPSMVHDIHHILENILRSTSFPRIRDSSSIITVNDARGEDAVRSGWKRVQGTRVDKRDNYSVGSAESGRDTEVDSVCDRVPSPPRAPPPPSLTRASFADDRWIWVCRAACRTVRLSRATPLQSSATGASDQKRRTTVQPLFFQIRADVVYDLDLCLAHSCHCHCHWW